MVKIIFEVFFVLLISKVLYFVTYKYISQITVSQYLDNLK
jgi:hypothetical protein